jgi:hypothetical protein
LRHRTSKKQRDRRCRDTLFSLQADRQLPYDLFFCTLYAPPYHLRLTLPPLLPDEEEPLLRDGAEEDDDDDRLEPPTLDDDELDLEGEAEVAAERLFAPLFDDDRPPTLLDDRLEPVVEPTRVVEVVPVLDEPPDLPPPVSLIVEDDLEAPERTAEELFPADDVLVEARELLPTKSCLLRTLLPVLLVKDELGFSVA